MKYIAVTLFLLGIAVLLLGIAMTPSRYSDAPYADKIMVITAGAGLIFGSAVLWALVDLAAIVENTHRTRDAIEYLAKRTQRAEEARQERRGGGEGQG
jgi:hypothetical protein